MASQNNSDFKLENFDDLFTGHPETIEKNLTGLLPQAERLEDRSIYLQILSQIALAQAMQRKFEVAHQTLDQAERQLSESYVLAKARILLERGRVFHQSDKIEQAMPFFLQSYELCAREHFDFHTINVAHMIAILSPDIKDKVKWNKIAIDTAKSSQDPRCEKWLSPILNNLAQGYIEAEDYERALEAFQQCENIAKRDENNLVARGAQWGIAKSLRLLGKVEQALEIQTALKNEYKIIAEKKELPEEMLNVARGLVHEELAEIHLQLSKEWAKLAFADLSKNPWVPKMMPERLEKMRLLQTLEVMTPISTTCQSYEKIATWYDEHRSRELFEKTWLDRTIQYLKPEACILDLGCGMGEPIARYFIDKRFELTGVDGSWKLIELAKTRLPKGKFIKGDMRNLKMAKRFDCVIAWNSFFHLTPDEQRTMFVTFSEHLNKDGVLLFTTGPQAGEIWSDNGGENLYHASLSPEEYQQLLTQYGFELIYHIENDPNCGDATVWLARKK